MFKVTQRVGMMKNRPGFNGGMAEWLMATLLKSVGGDEPSVGSNPTTTAKILR